MLQSKKKNQPISFCSTNLHQPFLTNSKSSILTNEKLKSNEFLKNTSISTPNNSFSIDYNVPGKLSSEKSTTKMSKNLFDPKVIDFHYPESELTNYFKNENSSSSRFKAKSVTISLFNTHRSIIESLSNSPKISVSFSAKKANKTEKTTMPKLKKKEKVADELTFNYETDPLLKPVKAYGENIKEILTYCNKTNICVKQIEKAKIYNIFEFKFDPSKIKPKSKSDTTLVTKRTENPKYNSIKSKLIKSQSDLQMFEQKMRVEIKYHTNNYFNVFKKPKSIN